MSVTDKYKVCVLCFTFNHVKYIEDAMNGFYMQQTDFPFVCCIVDDASTDGEQEVIKTYLEQHFDLNDQSMVRNEETDDYVLLFAQHRENRNCFFAVLLLKYNHYSIRKTKMPYIAEWTKKIEYEALCEGDDYWIHPRKLKMQYDYMLMHPNCTLVRTDVNRLNQITGEVEYRLFSEGSYKGKLKDTLQDYILNGWFAAPCTWLYKPSTMAPDVVANNKCFKGDIAMLLTMASNGEIGYIDEVTSVYRVLPNSASHFQKRSDQRKFMDSVKETRIIFAKTQNVQFRHVFIRKLCKERFPSSRRRYYEIPRWVSECIKDYLRLR